MRERLLFLSAFLPSSNAAQAGQKTAYRNLTWLAEKYDVWLGSFRNEIDRPEDELELKKICREMHIQSVGNLERFRGLLQRPFHPVLVASRWNGTMARQIQSWMTEQSFDRVHVEYTQMTAYNTLLKHAPAVTFYIHDILSQWAERRAAVRGFPWTLEAWRCRLWEKGCYRTYARVFVPSAKDRELLTALDPALSSRTEVLPLQFSRYSPAHQSPPGPECNLLFWGALGRKENADAARWLLREILPRLNSAGSPFRLVIAGSQPPADLMALRSPQVNVPGFVTDPGCFFQDANIAVLPVFDGAGVKVKVLECLAAGLPVLTTSIGAEGINAAPQDGLIVLPPDAGRFAQEIVSLSRDRLRALALAKSAKQWGEQQATDFRAMLLQDNPPGFRNS